MLRRPSTIPGDLDNWLQLLSRRCSPLAIDSTQRQERLAELAREVRHSRPAFFPDGMLMKRGDPNSDLSSSDSSGARESPDNTANQAQAAAQERQTLQSVSSPEAIRRREMILSSQGN